MGPKYEFTDETRNFNGRLLHRIQRIEDGKLGGWIESEDNLSQEGNCWVDDEAIICDDAKVFDNAKVYELALVYNDAKVYGNARVYGYAATVNCNAEVFGNAQVYDAASVYDNAKVYGEAEIYDSAYVYGKAKVYDYAEVYGEASVYGNAKVYDHAKVYNEAKVKGDAQVYDYAEVYGYAEVCDDYISGEVCDGYEYYIDEDEDTSNNEQSTAVVQDFIYNIDDSNKLTTQTEYDSVDEFFSEPVTNDVKLDTLIICAVDTKDPLIKLQKVKTDNKTEFKFIVDIINEDGDNFTFKSIIKSQEQLSQLIQQTIDALKNYSKFSKYADDLEDYLK